MKKATVVWIIVASALVVLGGLLFVGAMSINKWNFRSLSTVRYETNTYEIADDFNGISINTDTADITFLPSEDGKTKVVCYEKTRLIHSVEVRDGALAINAMTKKWYHHITLMNFDTPEITVYLPKTEYDALCVKESTGDIEIPGDFRFESMDISVSTGDVENSASVSESLKIKASTGDISLENISAGAIELSVTTGEIEASGIKCEGEIKVEVTTGKAELSDISCENLISSGSTGDISLTNVIAKESFSIERSTGDVKFDGCDAAGITVKTDTGDVRGSLLSEKIFKCRTDTGKVRVPDSVSGGVCDITTDTGSIIISIK